jgi:hypothetical protein
MNAFSQVAYGHIEWANLHSDRYQRHFAGQSRNTRDGSLLSELIVEAQAWLNQAEDHLTSAKDELSESARLDLTQRIERMRESEAMYQAELKAITQVQKEEGSPQERAGLYAHLANQCFGTYRAHFAGQARNSRRLATLERLTAQLDVIAEQMDTLISSARGEDFDQDQAQKNREVV